jgi:thioredoxin reductase (NADPH)
MAPQYVKDTPSSRVVLVGSPYDSDCRSIRSFLSANRVQYDSVDSELEPRSALPPVCRQGTMEWLWS